MNEPVIKELLQTRALQRLKGIGQFGLPDEIYHLKNYSRYTHSVGVMLLLQRLGASIEEQIAGLLHDVSHTAFSHTIDWVIGEGKNENFQDEHHEVYVKSSDIPRVLERYGYHTNEILDYHRFGLLEREAPDVCADRIDYAIREFPPKTAQQCLAALTTAENMIVFKDETTALLFARHFLDRQTHHWGGFEAASRYRLFADILRKALEKQIITLNDFWQDDAFVMQKIYWSEDEEILKPLTLLRQKSLAHLPKSNVIVYKKFRYVDPLFINHQKLMRLSEVNDTFEQEIAAARHINQQGIRIANLNTP